MPGPDISNDKVNSVITATGGGGPGGDSYWTVSSGKLVPVLSNPVAVPNDLTVEDDLISRTLTTQTISATSESLTGNLTVSGSATTNSLSTGAGTLNGNVSILLIQ